MKSNFTLVKQISVGLLIILFTFIENYSQTKRYPNELGVFKLFTAAKLERIEPLVSTKQDVVKIFDEVYPGQCDWKGIYEDSEVSCDLSDWKIIIGFIWRDEESYPKELWEKLEYIRVIPENEIFLKEADFGNRFEKTFGSVSHPEITLDIYYDNYGLRYEVIKKSNDSGFREGKLRQIKYSFSKSNYKKYVKNK